MSVLIAKLFQTVITLICCPKSGHSRILLDAPLTTKPSQELEFVKFYTKCVEVLIARVREAPSVFDLYIARGDFSLTSCKKHSGLFGKHPL